MQRPDRWLRRWLLALGGRLSAAPLVIAGFDERGIAIAAIAALGFAPFAYARLWLQRVMADVHDHV